MITLSKIKLDINDLYGKMRGLDPHEKGKKATLSKEIEKLKQIARYLEHDPDEDAIKDQLKVQSARLEKINENFKKWDHSHLTDKMKLRTKYEKECGVSHIKSQIATLEYILEVSH